MRRLRGTCHRKFLQCDDMSFVQDLLSSKRSGIFGECHLGFFTARVHMKKQERKRCLKGDGKCLISYDTQRKCVRCRLQRCFAAGMSTDSFLSAEEKERRKKRSKNDLHRPLLSQSTLLPSTSSTEENPLIIDDLLLPAPFDGIDHVSRLKPSIEGEDGSFHLRWCPQIC